MNRSRFVVSVSIALGILASFAPVSAESRVLFDDGFEGYRVGTPPRGSWGARYNAVTDRRHNAVTDEQAYRGRRSLRIQGLFETYWSAAFQIPVRLEGRFSLRFAYRGSGTIGKKGHQYGLQVTFLDSDIEKVDANDPNVHRYRALRFVPESDGIAVSTLMDDTGTGLGRLEASRWYVIEAVVDLPNRRITVTVDGKAFAEYAWRNKPDVPICFVAFECGASICWLDNVRFADAPAD